MNITIKSKLILGITLILVLMFSTLTYVLNQLSSMNERMTNIVDTAAERIILSSEVMYHVMDVARNEKNIIIEEDLAAMLQYEQMIKLSIDSINKKVNSLDQKSVDDGKNKIVEFQKFWIQYNKILAEIIKYAKNKDVSTSFKLSTGEAKTSRDAIINILNQTIDINKKQMNNDKSISQEAYNSSMAVIITLVILSLLLTILLTYWIIQTITSRISGISETAKKIASRELEEVTFIEQTKDELEPVTEALKDILESFREVTFNANEIAKGDYSIRISTKSKNDFLGNALNTMSQTLEDTTAVNEKHNWLTSGQNQLNEKLRGEQTVEQLTKNTILFISEYTKANIGALYLCQNNNTLKLTARFAFSPSESAKEAYSLGEGLPGQAAVGRKLIHLTHLKQENLRVSSSIIDAKPQNVLVVPFFKDEELLGVIELGKIDEFKNVEIEFINNSMQIIGIAISSAISRKHIQDLLEETQRQSEELQVQQEELKQANEELEEQTQNLKQQQEELQVANEELEEQTQSVELKNREMAIAKAEIEKKNKEVEMSSRFKSQFLANMSHELRTPLNSLLILSKDLSENKKGNLDETQIESARIVYKSGRDLLQLINEVLDLSKIEAGRMDLNIEEVPINEFVANINRNFSHIAKEKGLTLVVNEDPLLPEFIKTDQQRLDQIIKNLLSNAIKFTQHGSITVSMRKDKDKSLAIDVKDTGIGIPPEKQKVIFEAFHQADGSTSRKYGGTGLGLSISRELAKLLGGEIKLSSKANEGSVFTLIIPLNLSGDQNDITPKFISTTSATRPVTIIHKSEEFINYPGISDDRNDIQETDKSLLIIEDDLKFAGILMKLANNKGFKVIVASSGEDGLLLAEKYLPKAIVLDLSLPGIDGATVLSELKDNPSLRHIPVHIISAMERTLDPIKAGAVEYLMKPIGKDQLEEAFLRMESFINRKMKNLLIVEDDQNSRKSIKVLIGNGDVKCYEAENGKAALDIIQNNDIDCIVLDLGLPDISGFELIKKLQKLKGAHVPPIIIYTGKDLSKEENDELQSFAETIIIKGVKSEDRLLDETALFLHRTANNLPINKKEIITELYNNEAIFLSKKILVVDDDMRNIFALTKVLKEQGMEIVKAENGLKALEALEKHPDVSMILMDVMMPEMDGLEATRRIRAMHHYKDLPILILTAKAMKEDRKKCIDAGASDYISKPIELDRLLSLMKIWIKK